MDLACGCSSFDSQFAFFIEGDLKSVVAVEKPGVKIAIGHQIFWTELMKLLISYVKKFYKMPNSKINK